MCKVKQPSWDAKQTNNQPKRMAIATNAIVSLGKRKFTEINEQIERNETQPPLKVQKIGTVDIQSFIAAIRSGNESAFEELIDKIEIDQCDPILHNSPLHFAAFYNRIVFARKIIAKGANLNQINYLGATPLTTAIEKGHTLIVRILINSPNIDLSIVDKQGLSILHKAVSTGNAEILNFIIKNLRGKLSIDCCTNFDKLTALHQAAYNGQLPIVKILVNAGADVNAKTNTNTTPLHLAAIKNHEKVIKYLIKSYANVDAQDNYQRTALHYAAIYGHLDASENLIQGSANYTICDYQQETPVSISLKDYDISNL